MSNYFIIIIIIIIIIIMYLRLPKKNAPSHDWKPVFLDHFFKLAHVKNLFRLIRTYYIPFLSIFNVDNFFCLQESIKLKQKPTIRLLNIRELTQL